MTPRVRHLYRPTSLPVNLQHEADEATPPLTSPELTVSATDDEEKGMAMSPLRRASDMKLTSSIIQPATASTVCRDNLYYWPAPPAPTARCGLLVHTWSCLLSVWCTLVTTVSCAKTAKPIEMLFRSTTLTLA